MSGKHTRPFRHSPAADSEKLLIRIAPRDVGLFRFLLEGYDNLALFTVLDTRVAWLKLIFSPHQQDEVYLALAAMRDMLDMEISPWPWA